MKYQIVSPRIGTVGAVYKPDSSVNVDALLAGGFIKPLEQVSEELTDETTPAVAKSVKPKTNKATTEE